jgi:hypothetical protein
MKTFTTKLYTRYCHSPTEEYHGDQDKHFRTRKETQEYVDYHERGFGKSDTSHRYEIVEHDHNNLQFSTWTDPRKIIAAQNNS